MRGRTDPGREKFNFLHCESVSKGDYPLRKVSEPLNNVLPLTATLLSSLMS